MLGPKQGQDARTPDRGFDVSQDLEGTEGDAGARRVSLDRRLDAPEDVEDAGGAPMPFEIRDCCLTYMCAPLSRMTLTGISTHCGTYK